MIPQLPAENAVFPPRSLEPIFEQFAVNRAWWTADMDALNSFYTAEAGARTGGDAMHYNTRSKQMMRGGIKSRLISWWSGTPVTEGNAGRSTRMPSLLAGNIASLSGDAMFAEPPTTRALVGGKSVKGKFQDVLDELANQSDTHLAMSEGGELTAGLSAVALVARWDRFNADKPWSEVIACDAVIPQYEGSRLVATTLFTVYNDLNSRGDIVSNRYVHVEQHVSGFVVHALYKASGDTIGIRVPLDTIESTAYLLQILGGIRGADLSLSFPTGITTPTAVYWRNRPTKRFSDDGILARFGRADMEGGEAYLDSHAMVWSSWMRDIKLARARLIVPETFMDLNNPGSGGIFDDDQEVLTPLSFIDIEGGETITANQFKIRAEEHGKSLEAINREALTHAGWSSSSYGDGAGTGSGGGVTATEVVDRTTLTERTRDKKARYFNAPFETHLRAKLELNTRFYGGPASPAALKLDIMHTKLSQMDPEKEARVMAGLRSAQAASTKTLVRMLHPEWDDDLIEPEVVLIQEEAGIGPSADPGTEGRVDGEVDEFGNPIKPTPAADPVPADKTTSAKE